MEQSYLINWAKTAFICGEKGGSFKAFLEATDYPKICDETEVKWDELRERFHRNFGMTEDNDRMFEWFKAKLQYNVSYKSQE